MTMLQLRKGVTYCSAFVRLKPHAHMQNALKRVTAVQREAARFAYQTPNSFGGRGGGAKRYATPYENGLRYRFAMKPQ